MLLDNEKVSAIGILKSELKHDFLQFQEKVSILEMIIQQGINLNKLDKGAIIFNKNRAEGYKILSVDSNKYDTKYWLENFLGVDVLADDNFLYQKVFEILSKLRQGCSFTCGR